jgi:UDP-N-acetylmuramyl pentapeptide phosphotransferase/UDP-N-acetylglucosamine-1-phosphate transferase
MTENILLSLMMVLIPVTLAYLMTPFYIKLQEKRKITVMNFQGKRVVTTGGVILLVILFAVQPIYFFYPGKGLFPCQLMFLYISGITLLGLADDLWGDKKCKGFRGHFKELWGKKVISTGLYKAAGGFLLGTSVSALAGGGPWEGWLLKGIFLALFSNFFNLLDTRPARAAKVFLLFSLVFMLLFRELFLTVFPLWSALYIYLFWELDRRIMLGDTGAYLLGGALGFPLALRLAPGWLISLNILLLVLHYYCEKFSLNKLMESKKFFRLEGPERGS